MPSNPSRRRTACLRILCVALAASAAFDASLGASAEDAAGPDAADLTRYERAFDEIRGRLAADEAVKSDGQVTDMPWTSADQAPPRWTTREVPASAFEATVALASSGSWRGPGDVCTMAPGRVVSVLGSSREAGVLVRYADPRAAGRGGCGDGTTAFVPTAVLFAWPSVGSLAEARRLEGARLSAAAERILTGRRADAAAPAVP